MERGWIKLHYQFQKWEWYGCAEMVALFIHLLVDANYEDRKWMGRTIYRGQLVTSISKLSKSVGLSVKQTRTCIERLQQTGEIVKVSTNKWTIITICNYDKYQWSPTTEWQANGKQEASKGQHLKNIRNKDIIERDNNARMCVPAREEPNPQPPSHDPFTLSSVEKDMCRFDASLAVRIKRTKVERILTGVAGKPEIQMPDDEQKKFVDWYCEPVSEGSTTVRAETLQAFTVYGAAKRWMEKRREQGQKPSGKSDKQSLGDYYKDLINKMGNKYGFGQTDTSIPDEQ